MLTINNILCCLLISVRHLNFIGSAIASVAGSLIIGSMQSSAASDASNAQAGAANNATASQLQMFDTVNQQQAPYRDAGNAALSKLRDLLGIGTPQSATTDNGTPWGPPSTIPGTWQGQQDHDANGHTYVWDGSSWQRQAPPSATSASTDPSYGSLLKPFSAQDLSQWQDPGYTFRLNQGMGALQNSQAASSGLVNGNSLRDLINYGQDAASQEYTNAFNRYNVNQSNIYNRLSNIAGLGQTSTQTTAQTGTNLAGNIGSAQMAAGAANAAGAIGRANAWSGALNNAMGWYNLGNIMNGGWGGGWGGSNGAILPGSANTPNY